MRSAPNILHGVLLSVAVLAAGGGCASPAGSIQSRELAAAQFNDVPVPRDYVLELGQGRSWTYSEGGGGPGSLRLGHLEYTGTGTVENLVTWYETEMLRPLNGWNDIERRSVTGERALLLFGRPGDRCAISLTQEGAIVRIVVERNTGEAGGEVVKETRTAVTGAIGGVPGHRGSSMTLSVESPPRPGGQGLAAGPATTRPGFLHNL